MNRKIILILAATQMAPTHPADNSSPTPIALDLHLSSFHIGRQKQGLNQWNPGVGLTYHYSKSLSFSAGEYYNSYRLTTVYGMADYRPWEYGPCAFGIFGGFFSNYGKKQQGVFGGGLSLEANAFKHLALDARYVPPFSHGLGNVLGFTVKVPF